MNVPSTLKQASLSALWVSGCLDYPNWVMTVQLKSFVKSVRFIRVLNGTLYVKMYELNYPNFSIV